MPVKEMDCWKFLRYEDSARIKKAHSIRKLLVSN